jgi:sigma-B regulation protein RsbU (phosphoserine phosphatase)
MMSDTPAKYTILAVDDTPENLDVVKGILSSDYIVKAATSGAMALKIAEKQLPDLILLDIMMPEMDGYEVCQKLKENEATKDIPVIFLTAMDQTTDEKRGFELGAADYMTKPVNPPILKARVSTHLALKHSMDELQSTYDIIKKHKDRMEQELNVAHDIQMSMLPQNDAPFPDRQEFELRAMLIPAREVGGDFYDYFFINDDEICLIVGDVSGKGVPAALFMAVSKTMLKTSAMDDPSPASILTRVNDELSADNPSCMFVTVFLAVANVRTGNVRYSNAGHNPPYLLHKNGALTCLDQRHGPILGAMGGIAFKESTAEIRKGELIYVFTDGVTEAMDAGGQLYSEARLEEVLTQSNNTMATDLIQRSLDDVNAHAYGAEQSDDITVLAFRLLHSPKESLNPTLELSVGADLREIQEVNEAVDAFCANNQLSREISQKLGVIFDELLNNTINYGFGDSQEHEIVIQIEVMDDRLHIKVSDNGIPFNPFDHIAPDTTLSVDEREIGGLGVLLVTKMTDSHSYQRLRNRNIITLTIILVT